MRYRLPIIDPGRNRPAGDEDLLGTTPGTVAVLPAGSGTVTPSSGAPHEAQKRPPAIGGTVRPHEGHVAVKARRFYGRFSPGVCHQRIEPARRRAMSSSLARVPEIRLADFLQSSPHSKCPVEYVCSN